MRRTALALATILALVLPAAAAAGGFATLGISPLPGDDLRGGDRWTPTLEVLQHGQTPLDGLQPVLTIRNTTSGATETFFARPAGEPGKYVVDVRFPSDGRWAYEVYDDFATVHTFAPVTVGQPLSGGGRTWAPFTLGAALLAGLLAGALAVRRRASPTPSASTG